MNLAFGSKLAGLQKPFFWKCFSIRGWYHAVLKRNIFAAAAISERLSRDMVQKTVETFKEYNLHHDFSYNRPILHLWYLNRYKAKLIAKASQHEIDDINSLKYFDRIKNAI